jgi:hypothetical protein
MLAEDMSQYGLTRHVLLQEESAHGHHSHPVGLLHVFGKRTATFRSASDAVIKSLGNERVQQHLL